MGFADNLGGAGRPLEGTRVNGSQGQFGQASRRSSGLNQALVGQGQVHKAPETAAFSIFDVPGCATMANKHNADHEVAPKVMFFVPRFDRREQAAGSL